MIIREQYLKDTWNKILEDLKINRNIDSEIINNFYAGCNLYELTEEKAIIVAENIIEKQILYNDLDVINSSFINVLNLDKPLFIEVDLEHELPTYKEINEPIVSFDDSDFSTNGLNPEKTFDNFVVGNSNRESQAAALACAINPAYFNPLFIYGNSGLGKTHLLMAIGNYVQKADPTKKVYYIETIKFVEKVTETIKENKIDAFKRYLYNIDLLLIDDIQFLAGNTIKNKSNEVLFSIYDELISNRKQICIACDRQPREIKGIEDRLITRFSSGLSVSIDSPEFETSLEILKNKVKENGYGFENKIDDEGLAYIASNFSGNVRSLEGALNSVLFNAIVYQPDGGEIKFETVVNALKSQAVVSDKTGLSPRKIINAVADYYGLTRQQITSKTRTKNIANARHISIFLCRKLLDLPFTKIGEEFGGRDHTTIMSACNKVENQIKEDTLFKTAIKEIESQLST